MFGVGGGIIIFFVTNNGLAFLLRRVLVVRAARVSAHRARG